jgi:hypothetical protein
MRSRRRGTTLFDAAPLQQVSSLAMSTLTLELRPLDEQTALNLRRWDEVLADPELRKLPGRVETDRHGRIIMSPPPAPIHGKMQAQVANLLGNLLPHGTTITECPISTADGVKGVDVAWASSESWGEVGNRTCFLRRPRSASKSLPRATPRKSFAKKWRSISTPARKKFGFVRSSVE